VSDNFVRFQLNVEEILKRFS